MDPRTEVIVADITTLDVDVIVNAANQRLAGGGGVDAAIHRAAGARELHDACAKLGGCATGDAKLTPGFGLKAKWIAHAVGPRWRGGAHGEREALASCYRRALDVSRNAGARTIAFPAISTGIYGFPGDLAAEVAVSSVDEALAGDTETSRVVFCCFSEDSAALHRTAMEARL